MGGIYVVPKVESTGHLNFVINGILVAIEDGWRLVCPFTDTDDIFQMDAVVVSADYDETELTPNGSKKK